LAFIHFYGYSSFLNAQIALPQPQHHMCCKTVSSDSIHSKKMCRCVDFYCICCSSRCSGAGITIHVSPHVTSHFLIGWDLSNVKENFRRCRNTSPSKPFRVIRFIRKMCQCMDQTHAPSPTFTLPHLCQKLPVFVRTRIPSTGKMTSNMLKYMYTCPSGAGAALQRHCNGAATALQRRWSGLSTPLEWPSSAAGAALQRRWSGPPAPLVRPSSAAF